MCVISSIFHVQIIEIFGVYSQKWSDNSCTTTQKRISNIMDYQENYSGEQEDDVLSPEEIKQQQGQVVYQYEEDSDNDRSEELSVEKTKPKRNQNGHKKAPKTDIDSKDITISQSQSQRGQQLDERKIIHKAMAEVLINRTNLTREKLIEELKKNNHKIKLEDNKYKNMRYSFCHIIIRQLEKYISLAHNLPIKPIENKAIGGLLKDILMCKLKLNNAYCSKLLNFIKHIFLDIEVKPNPAILLLVIKLFEWKSVKALKEKQMAKNTQDKQKEIQMTTASKNKNNVKIDKSFSQQMKKIRMPQLREDNFLFGQEESKSEEEINYEDKNKLRQNNFSHSKYFCDQDSTKQISQKIISYDSGLTLSKNKEAKIRYNDRQLEEQYMYGGHKRKRNSESIHKVNQAWSRHHEKLLRRTFSQNQNFYYIIRKFKDRFPEMKEHWNMKCLKGRFTRTARAAFRRLREIIGSEACIDLPPLVKLDERVYGQIIRSDRATKIQLKLFDLLRDQPLRKQSIAELIELINQKQRIYNEKEERIQKMLLGGQKKNVLQHQLGVLSSDASDS